MSPKEGKRNKMIIDGIAISKENEILLKKKIEMLDLHPTLLIASCDPDRASEVYIQNKRKACERLGIKCRIEKIDPSENTDFLISKIKEWNVDPEVSGIIVQLPIPKHFNVKSIQKAIDPIKDVDGFHPESVHLPCTPDGVIQMAIHEGYDFSGSRCVVIGRSDIVGKPLAKLLRDMDATVTVCHSKTNRKYLEAYCRYADYIFCAAGVPNLITPECLRWGQTVVFDISINRNEEGKLCGDLSPEAIPMLKAYTPVPGGVGPMTVNTLMAHTIKASIMLMAIKKIN